MNLPLHPALVHFPIALLVTAFIFQALHLWKSYWICRTTSMWLLGFAAITCFAASVSGQEEAAQVGQSGLDTVVLDIIQRHELMANITTWGSAVVIISWVYFFLKDPHDIRVDRLALAFLGLLAGVVVFTGYLGGTLTFIYGVGIP
ncbi:MAG: DUF2231 domain-containing protein [Candidatus Marinimicrobia bacterium]|nr:DUF2231 domain-containing protein [Candidatus Neomarinimicrobiota bacterium]